MNGAFLQRGAALATAAATAVVVVAFAIVPFLTPQWVTFEQGRAGAAALTGYAPDELRSATESILADLIAGPPAFDAEVRGQAVLTERERAHMQDVRGVFGGFGLLAVVAATGLAASYLGARRLGHPERWWSAVRGGARTLAVGVIVAGLVALLAFDAAFEVFHRLFFAGGSYTFDPARELLVQLFPFAFWSETTMAFGAWILVLAVGTAWLAGRRTASRQANPDGHPVGVAEAAR